MDDPLDKLQEQVTAGRNYESPPLELWHPPLSGDIPIHIDAQGVWSHEGVEITRQSLVQLFASILRRERDGEYYLVTPVEKWRVTVELHPLLVTDIDRLTTSDGESILDATLNTGKLFRVSEANPLFLEPKIGNIAAITLPHGLTAVCTRSAWYRLVDMSTTANGSVVVKSGSYEFPLPTV